MVGFFVDVDRVARYFFVTSNRLKQVVVSVDIQSLIILFRLSI